jgi:nucleoid-associated protein YgaU
MSLIARLRAVRAAAILITGALALAACASVGSGVTSGPAAEAERLRIVDACMAQSGQAKSAKDSTAPRCQCIARGVLSGVTESEATATCARNAGSYTVAARRTPAKRAATAPAPAAAPAEPVPAAGDAPKEE